MISFIMPIYNTDVGWIRRSVKSIVEQTLDELELLIIDDGSENKIADLIDDISANDKRIKVFHKVNQGSSVARNVGMDHAKGEYVAFIDADDWIEADYIEQVQPYLDEYCPDMLAFAHADHGGSGIKENLHGTKEFYIYDKIEKKEMQLVVLHKDKPSDMYQMFFGAPWNIVYRKEFLDGNNIRYVPGLFKAQDSVFNLYALEKAEKITYLNKVLYHYNKNDASVTHRYKGGHEHICKLLLEYRKFIETYHKGEKEYMDVYNYGGIIVFDGLCKLNFFHINNPHPVTDRKREMKELLNTPPFSDIVNEVDVGSLTQFKRMQIFAMRHRWYQGIKILFWLKQMRHRI